jgi:prevent-host-death family protein
MKTMTAEKFRRNCLSEIANVLATGEPVVVTRRGKPFVKVIPITSGDDNLFGFMAGKFRIVGNVESPVLHAGKCD